MFWLRFADQTTFKGRGPAPHQSPSREPGNQPGSNDQDVRQISSEINEVVLALLPWGISFLLHIGIVVLAIFIIWSAIERVEDAEKPLVPIARLSQTPGTPLKMKTTRKITTSSASRRSSMRSLTGVSPTMQRETTTESRLIGVLGATRGRSNPFRSGISTETGLGANLFGVGGNAHRIVYLIDASGSLIDSLDYVILELKRSIHELSPKQVFTVIFFQGEQVVEVKPKQMKPATPENKRRVIEWIDPAMGNIMPIGPTNPIPALKLALQYKPQLLFILSDNITGTGRYEVDRRRLLEEIENANKGKAKINTIQFLYRDKLEDYGLQPTLELIAQRNGGHYKFVDAKELGIE